MIATVNGHQRVKRLMICEADGGAYLFVYEQEEDGACAEDQWFDNVADAQDCAAEDFGVRQSDWSQIDGPMPHCQDDWIQPVRIPGRETGSPQWGKFEVLRDGQWIEIVDNNGV